MKATIEMKNGGKMVFELDEQNAPITVKNFVKLAKQDFYEDVIFHRVIKGFMIQGGDPTGTGMGGPGYTIKGEFASTGVNNPIQHTRGVISMARAMDPNSAGSQFFIMHADAPHLDGQYAAFGQVFEGEEVAIDISRVPRDMRSDMPKTPVVIQSVRVDTQGVYYPAPKTH